MLFVSQKVTCDVSIRAEKDLLSLMLFIVLFRNKSQVISFADNLKPSEFPLFTFSNFLLLFYDWINLC